MISLKAKIWRIALAPALLVFSASAALAQETAGNSREEAMEHKFELASTYYTECKHTESAEFDEIRPYLKAFTDIEVMAKIMANPVETARLMRIVADPRTMHVMMKCSTEPVMWDTWMRGLTDINKMLNASLVFMNPMTYVNWMIAPFQPAVYTNTFSILGPDNLSRWGTALINPSFYEPLYQPIVSPSWFVPRLNWMIDGESWEPVVDLLKSVYEPIEDAVTLDSDS